MPRPLHGFSGRRVKWDAIKPNHDQSTIMKDARTGVVLETHWEGNTLWAIVVEKSGLISQHEITDLTLVMKNGIMSHDTELPPP